MSRGGLVMDTPGRPPFEGSDRYRAWVERLFALSKSGMHLGLDPIARVLAALGHPEQAFPCVHIAGSNGKGSTAAFAAAILSADGLKVGLYTSPHLISLTERVQIVEGGRASPISEEALVDALDEVARGIRAARSGDASSGSAVPELEGLTFFEAITAAGLVALRDAKVDVAVVEAGLGARLDATRLVRAEVSILTDLALEHTEILGDTLEAIAHEKSAVARPGKPLVAADAPAGPRAVIEAATREIGAELFVLGERFHLHGNADTTFDFDLGDRPKLERVSLSLLGAHQGRNAILAAKAATLFRPSLSEATLRAGLGRAAWPGRLEIFEGGPAPVLLDGAHNREGAEILARALERHRARFRGPLHVVFGILGDKDGVRMAASLAPLATSFVLTRPGSPRAEEPEALRARLEPEIAARAEVLADPEAAFEEASKRAHVDGGWVVVCGSLYLVGQIRARLLTQL